MVFEGASYYFRRLFLHPGPVIFSGPRVLKHKTSSVSSSDVVSPLGEGEEGEGPKGMMTR